MVSKASVHFDIMSLAFAASTTFTLLLYKFIAYASHLLCKVFEAAHVFAENGSSFDVGGRREGGGSLQPFA